jgi:hypothetical protein
MEFMAERNGNTYPVDTVLADDTVTTEEVLCWGAFSLGSRKGEEVLDDWLATWNHAPSILGVGVTEAGLESADTKAMHDLFHLLKRFHVLIEDGKWQPPKRKIAVVCTDNIPSNGDRISLFMNEIYAQRSHSNEDVQDKYEQKMGLFLRNSCIFLNTMVDRITSQRKGSHGIVPRCEPLPKKALVVLDADSDLPPTLKDQPGVLIRRSREQMDTDVALKLRIANGTHTAIAHALALQNHLQTTVLSTKKPGLLFIDYLESLVCQQIIPATISSSLATKEEAQGVWEDWKRRLMHPHFGLSTLFITQDGAAEGGIRLGPTVVDLLSAKHEDSCPPWDISVSMAFAYAALLRWLTPLIITPCSDGLKGWFQPHNAEEEAFKANDTTDATEYADGLCYSAENGWYDYKCSLRVIGKNGMESSLAALLFECRGRQPLGCVSAVRTYLLAKKGGNLTEVASNPKIESLVHAIATLYSQMLAGDDLEDILEKLSGIGFASSCDVLSDGINSISQSSANVRFASGIPLAYHASPIHDDSNLLDLPLDKADVRSIVFAEVAASEVIDLHTHILPPSHGSLCLWGIDELLTYHYLVAEYFMTAPESMTPESFYDLSTQEQAEVIWKALFIDRSPISEACRGVLTTLKSLGLEGKLATRDLEGIRGFYRKYQKRGEAGAEDFCERVFQISGVRYVIMTNIPFSRTEAQYWRGPNKQTYSKRFRSSLRVDPLLAGDSTTIKVALKGSGYDVSLEGARQYLRDWIDTMKPEYLMASTPHDFVFEEGSLAGIAKSSVNKEALHEPFAFVKAQQAATCNGTEDDAPSVVDEDSDFLGEVLMKVAEERDLPVALKIGAHRGVNPRLKAAGDGVVAFADAGLLGRLCTKFPRVRFLATFLSRSNQHEAVVLATKFRNLHLYGCWWFCNNPSIIQEMTSMRIEMLGTAFTAQHSDARVVDQLLYKWPHSRGVIAAVITGEVEKMMISGWMPTRREIRRDIRRLFGTSYVEFMAKSFV